MTIILITIIKIAFKHIHITINQIYMNLFPSKCNKRHKLICCLTDNKKPVVDHRSCLKIKPKYEDYFINKYLEIKLACTLSEFMYRFSPARIKNFIG